MATWADFEKEAPEIAPAIAQGRLWAFVMEGSPKRRDLDSNAHFAIHALPGPQDEEFYVAGAASRVSDPELRRVVLAAMPYDDADERHLLYEFSLDRALWTTWENFQKPGMRPIHRVWRAASKLRERG